VAIIEGRRDRSRPVMQIHVRNPMLRRETGCDLVV
jgi:hypothetical protein